LSDNTGIGWTAATWNPVVGCTRKSAGCDNCYAVTMTKRLAAMGQAKYQGLVNEGKGHFNGTVRFVPEALSIPLRWRTPRRIFVNSMSDLFHDRVSDEHIAAIFGVMAAAPRHVFQILTKRPERMLRWFEWMDTFSDGLGQRFVAGAMVANHLASATVSDRRLLAPAARGEATAETWPPPNVWLGVSCEDQAAADERIPLLLQCPAAVRWVSAEPLLGPIELKPWLRRSSRHHLKADVEGMLRNRAFDALCDDAGKPLTAREAENELLSLRARGVKYIPAGGCDAFDPQKGCPGHPNPALSWVVVGGESGRGWRGCWVAWIENIVEQCRAADVPCFVKQDSGARAGMQGRLSDELWAVKQWPGVAS
jgi:protein gp37